MTPDVTIAHRYPTLRFPRRQDVEDGAQVCIYWNGTRAPNKDGISGAETAIDYATPLAGPLPIWTRGHRTIFGGGWLAGPWLEPHARPDPAGGFLSGPWLMGGWMDFSSWWTWRLPFALRDGLYQFAMLVRDSAGNEEAQPGTVLIVQVRALPRPAKNLQVAFDPDTGEISAAWDHSPEFEAVA